MKRRLITQLAAVLICLLLAGGVNLARILSAGRIEGQQAAELWQTEEGRCAQVSFFLPESRRLTENEIMGVRQNLRDTLAGQTELNWTDAYSCVTRLSLSSEYATVTARAIAVGGDFFLFHGLDMMSGACFDEGEANRDGVVLDMELAWRLFGGYDLEGMHLLIGSTPVEICGVARSPKGGAMADAYGEEPTVWLSSSLLERMNGNAVFQSYEAVLAEPVSGFALESVEKALNPGDGAEAVKNTGRFGLIHCLRNAWALVTQSAKVSPVALPYWELAARTAETRCAMLALLTVLLLLYPLVWVLVQLVKLVICLKRRFRAWKKRRNPYHA